MDEVETRFARSDTGWIAYQVVGTGPTDMLVMRPNVFPIDLMWDSPPLVHFLDGLSTFSRHIWFDPRGTGASDGVDQSEARLVESMVDDAIAVLDEVGCERVVVLGLYSMGPLLFAAAHPERTEALVLLNPSARTRVADDYPEGMPDDVYELVISGAADPHLPPPLGAVAPSLKDDPSFVRWMARADRLNIRRADAPWRLSSLLDVDLRDVVGAIRVPTMVVYRRECPVAGQSRYVAARIAGAKVVELPGTDTFFFSGDTGPVLDAIAEFATGNVVLRDDDRVLATVMFTDVVRSTEQLVDRGDRPWQALLDRHDAVVRRELERFRGQEINTTGDGFVATFDGPGRAIKCASSVRDSLRAIGIDVRIGLHTGEIERRGRDIGGIAVHIAQRIQALADPGEVLASSTVRDLVGGSGIAFIDRGEHELKGVPERWRVFQPSPS